MADNILKRIRYIATDFNSILLELQNKVKQYDAWKDINYEDSIGATLLDLYAYIGDLLLYHLYMVQNENFLATAQLKKNIMKIVKMLNYKPAFATPARGKVKIFLDNPYGSNIEIPKYTKLSNKDGIPFITLENAAINAGDTEVEIEVAQGILKTTTIMSDGSEYQRYGINLKNEDNYITNIIIDKNGTRLFKGITVFVDNVEWEETDYLILSNEDDINYIIENYNDYGVYIQFGNNINGKIPPNANLITIQYLLTLGEKGKIKQETIDGIDDNIFDINGIAVNDLLNITNEYAFSNGANPESIEKTKALAPKWFATGNRGITKEDIKVIIQKYFQSIKDILVWAEEDENPPNFKLYNTVKISILLEDENGLPVKATDEQLKEFDEYLINKRSLTVWRKYIDPIEIDFDIKIEYKKKIGTLSSSVQNLITNAIENYFKQYGLLGITIKHSDLVSIIDNLNSYVDYCYIYIKKTNTTNYEMKNFKLNFNEYPMLKNITFVEL